MVDFAPVQCFVVTEIEDWWLETDLDITTAEGWLARYNVGAVLDRRHPDGEGHFHVVTPLGPVDLNRPEMRWTLSGEAPNWTAQPSIRVGPVTLADEPFCWHGYLTDGVLQGSWEAHP